VSAVYLLARVRDERYAFPVYTVREVARALAVTPVPGAPPAVRGVHNLRGEVVPLLELATLLGLGLGLGAGEADCVIVAEDGGRRAGLTVDELLDVRELRGELEDAHPPLVGSALVDGELVGVVDVGAILDAIDGAGRR
jgi:purine-binding chemotaxis protein CheW